MSRLIWNIIRDLMMLCVVVGVGLVFFAMGCVGAVWSYGVLR